MTPPHRICVALAIILLAGTLFAGCITQEPAAPDSGQYIPDGGQPDPIVGAWNFTHENILYIYVFREDANFTGWSLTRESGQRFTYRYSGKWEHRGQYLYEIDGAWIASGIGNVTGGAIWRTDTLAYDLSNDTMTSEIWPGDLFTRISREPEVPEWAGV